MFDIEKKSNEIVKKAIITGASDVHIIPCDRSSKIQFRVDDRLVFLESITNLQAEKLISHLKFISKMDIGERRKPQSGSILMIVNNNKINIRISTLPTAPHESMAIRILPQNETNSLQTLTTFPKQNLLLKSLVKNKHGLILVSGPTGSGKTTTIYSLLNDVNKLNKRIICIEDPIEKRNDAFIQLQINEKAGLTYANLLKAVLRHDPDIIMIGEIRDEATAKIAIRAAMTGHLVISTIHAKNCIGSVFRLKEFGIKPIDIKETIVGLISQRLVELNCSFCGDLCVNFCRQQRRRRRMAIFEILSGKQLDSYLTKQKEPTSFESFEKMIKKTFALGYISKTEYERWLSM